jgi:diguanylate cyclase (GGDEF)-like protein
MPAPSGEQRETGFHESFLDSVGASISVVDRTGSIVYVNHAWITFGEQNGVAKGFVWEGVNYLDACGSGDDSRVTEGIRSVLANNSCVFSCDYPCHGPGALRWFTLHVVPVRNAAGHFLITHTDITGPMQVAHQDALTGLPNRRLLMDRLQHFHRDSRRSGLYGGVLFLDLDRFKALNDSAGHASGDTLLREVGQRLMACVREVDTVARYGGDEFVLLLTDLGPYLEPARRHLERAAGRILQSLSKPYTLGVLEHRTSASVGMAVFQGCDPLNQVLHEADAALYQAKREGGGRARLHLALEATAPTVQLAPTVVLCRPVAAAPRAPASHPMPRPTRP